MDTRQPAYWLDSYPLTDRGKSCAQATWDPVVEVSILAAEPKGMPRIMAK